MTTAGKKQPSRQALLPKARREGFEIQEVGGEVLVYDLERHRAFGLNQVASLIWKHCDDETSYAEMVSVLEKEMQIRVDQEVVRMVVARLKDEKLVQSGSKLKKYSRRDLMNKAKKLGLAATVMLPLVTSIVAPTPAYAQSCVAAKDCATSPNCTPCGGSCLRECCAGLCLPPFLAAFFCGC